mmetsp:Transcript_8299/g.13515  ORF Transcript_8299/g.13515 Transcript_8299/m.13515 type:complete len:333 (-) Transcript_8299:537-1535(-)
MKQPQAFVVGLFLALHFIASIEALSCPPASIPTVSVPGSVTNGVISASTPNYIGYASGDTFYQFSFTGYVRQHVKITTCAPRTNFDTFVRVYSGCPVEGKQIDVSDDDSLCGSSGLASTLVFYADPNTVYVVHVEGFDSAVGNFALVISLPDSSSSPAATATPTRTRSRAPTSTPIPNAVIYNRKIYRLLDGSISPQNAGRDFCQTDPLSVPAGWSLAPRNADSIAVSKLYPWGTDCLILADGSTWETSDYTSGLPNQDCWFSPSDAVLGYDSATGAYQVLSCAREILLVKNTARVREELQAEEVEVADPVIGRAPFTSSTTLDDNDTNGSH